MGLRESAGEAPSGSRRLALLTAVGAALATAAATVPAQMPGGMPRERGGGRG